MDLARLFLSNTTAMRQVEGGLYHLTPLVGAVNALVTKMGFPPISARNILFGLWAILQVRMALLHEFHIRTAVPSTHCLDLEGTCLMEKTER